MDEDRKISRPTSLEMGQRTVIHERTLAVPQSKMEVMVIDLCTPEVVLDESVQHRLSILAVYPSKESDEQHFPLLTNVPCKPQRDDRRVLKKKSFFTAQRLTQQEWARRYVTVFKPAFEIIDHDLTIPSFLREKQELFFRDLLERLQVDITLLDYNYTRLNKYLRMLTCDQVRVFNLRPHETQWIEEKEYPLALEFYLQFDVNMFYMKTCSFRFARPRTMNEGLFCVQEPEARYELTSCGNCGLCYPRYNRKYRARKSVVEFSQAHKHTFVNGYEAILNCSAVSSLCSWSLSLSNDVELSYAEHRLCLDLSVWESGLYRCDKR